MTPNTHVPGQRVRDIFDGREGVVIESNQRATLIEFDDYCEVERYPFKHRKWLPTRHWKSVEGQPA